MKHIQIRRTKGVSTLKMLLAIPVFLLILLILAIGFHESRKAYWDYQVRELCAKDGGIKVYETVKLLPEKFNEWGQVNFYRPTQNENALGSEYIFKADENYYRKWNPSFVRYHHQVLRRSDGKLLGETTSYGRGGGDLPGPWEPSNYHCPPTSSSSEIALFKNIFVLSGKE